MIRVRECGNSGRVGGSLRCFAFALADCSAIADEDHGDVSRTAAIEGGDDQLIHAFCGRQLTAAQERGDLGIADFFSETIAA